MKPVSLLFFLLGLALAFPAFSSAYSYAVTYSRPNDSFSCVDNGWSGNYFNYGQEYDGTFIFKGQLWVSDYSMSLYIYSVVDNGSTGCAVVYDPKPPDEPDSCSNTVVDGDEEGLNCGGSCVAECEPQCPTGSTSAYVNSTLDSCFNIVSPNIVGVCPDGYSPTDEGCYAEFDPVLAAPEATLPGIPEPQAQPVLTDSDLSETEATYSSETLPDGTYVETEVITETTDFADGTTKTVETTITTSTGIDGSSTTSSTTSVTLTNSDGTAGENTTTEVVTDYDSEGNVIGSTTEVSESTSGDGSVSDPSAETDLESLFDDEPGDYLPDSYDDSVTLDDSFEISPSEYGESPDWETLKDDLDPLLNEIDAVADSTLQLDSPSCVLDIPTMYGRSDLQFSFCEYASYFQTAGVFLVAFVYVLGFIFLFERG